MAARTTTRIPMPIKMRAKQFAMFDALKGLTEAIAEKERQSTPKRILAENRINEISFQLSKIQKGDEIQVVYYCDCCKQYCHISGIVMKVDSFWKTLQINEVVIDFDDIYSILFDE